MQFNRRVIQLLEEISEKLDVVVKKKLTTNERMAKARAARKVNQTKKSLKASKSSRKK